MTFRAGLLRESASKRMSRAEIGWMAGREAAHHLGRIADVPGRHTLFKLRTLAQRRHLSARWFDRAQIGQQGGEIGITDELIGQTA